mmetsp:Transcript_11356/g.19137  ORF Transcript_11356/g.19137 Transcript_11356/m.19137 type:complete len:139 (-) Transcript_11356:24-440(-)
MLALCPDIDTESESAMPQEGGWQAIYDHIEDGGEMVERVKNIIRDLKEMHKQKPDQTVLVISHGHVLRSLMCILTNQLSKQSSSYICKNNSLTIVDFMTCMNVGKQHEYVESQLQCFNLQMIEEVESVVKRDDSEPLM